MIEDGTVIEPGQELALEGSSLYSRKRYRIVVVDRITPSGLIVLLDGSTYHPNGRERSSASVKSWLHILTPEICASIERGKNLDYLKSCKWENLDDEILKEAVALLKARASK